MIYKGKILSIILLLWILFPLAFFGVIHLPQYHNNGAIWFLSGTVAITVAVSVVLTNIIASIIQTPKE